MTGSGSLFNTSDQGQQQQALVKHKQPGGSDLEIHPAEAQRKPASAGMQGARCRHDGE